jgi:hypothetical protein
VAGEAVWLLEALTIIDHRSQEGRDLVETLTVEDEETRGGNNTNTSAEWSWWFEIESDCRCTVIVDFNDTGEMCDRHTAAGEVVGDEKVVAFNGYPLNWPRPYKPNYAYDTPKDDAYPLSRRTAQSAPNP